MNKTVTKEIDDFSINISLDENGDGDFIVFDKSKQKIKEKTIYKNNKKNGKSITYFYDDNKNGRIETPFVDDEIQGTVLYYTNDIIIREENFVNNKKNGITKDYKIVDGERILWVETPYENGVKNGISTEYNNDGKTIKRKIMWIDGKEANID